MRAPAGPASSLPAHSRVHLHNRRFIQVRRPDRAAHSPHDLLALRSELPFRLLALCGVDPLDLDQPSEHASSFRRNVAAILCLVGRSLNLGLLWLPPSPAVDAAADSV